MTAPDTRTFLKVKDMCQILGVSRPTLRALIASGAIRASRLSDARAAHYRFHPDEPSRYLKAMQERVAS